MRLIKLGIYLLLLTIITVTSNGCATYKTINKAQINSPKIFSGTRLDFHTITKNHVALKKFKVNAPRYPLLDLPASIIVDIAVSPLTFGLTGYEMLFY